MKWVWLFLLLSCYVPTSFHYMKVSPVEGHRVINIWVDPDFGDADRIAIDSAITQWNYALNGNIKLEIGKDDWVLMKVRAGEGLSWSGENEAYFVRNKIANEEMEGLVIYEIGHLLGSRIELDVDWEHYKCVDWLMIKGVSKALEIPMDKLNYCVYED